MIYRLVTRVIQYFCFPERPMKGGDILDFQKGGVDLEKVGYEPPYQLWASYMILWKLQVREKSGSQVIAQNAPHQSDCRIFKL